VIDPYVVRERFPALSRTQDGRPCVFADAPGGTQVPDTVIDAMVSYLRNSNSNVHGAFATSQETDALIAGAHAAAADLFGCDPSEVVIGQNATTLLLHVSRSIARTLRPGDEIVVTRLDHDANVAPWRLIAEDVGAEIRWADIREEDVSLDLDSVDAAISDRTRVVAFTSASNAVGTITPAAEIVQRAHEAGALAVVDAVHFAQHRAMDVRSLGADVAVCSAYKFFGPHVGALFGRRELLEELRPYKTQAAADVVPGRWETGTLNHEGMAGMTAAVDYLAGFGDPAGDRRGRIVAGMEAIREHEAALARRFLEGLDPLPEVRLWGIRDRVEDRTPTFAIRVGDQHPLETAKALAERGVFVWDGHYYAIAVMERLGLLDSGGAVRIGFCHYNTADEVDRVLEELAALS